MHTKILSSHEIFRALGDPSRLRMAVLLLEKELCVCDLMAVLEMSQSSVSRHMSVLRSAGLAADRRDGRWAYYRLVEPMPLTDLRACLAELTSEAPHSADLAKLHDHLKTKGCQA